MFLKKRLLPHELAGSKPRDALEEAGEMMGEIETEQARGLTDVMPLHQQTLRLIDNVVVDVADGRTARCLVDDVAKVTWRIGQL